MLGAMMQNKLFAKFSTSEFKSPVLEIHLLLNLPLYFTHLKN